MPSILYYIFPPSLSSPCKISYISNQTINYSLRVRLCFKETAELHFQTLARKREVIFTILLLPFFPLKLRKMLKVLQGVCHAPNAIFPLLSHRLNLAFVNHLQLVIFLTPQPLRAIKPCCLPFSNFHFLSLIPSSLPHFIFCRKSYLSTPK